MSPQIRILIAACLLLAFPSAEASVGILRTESIQLDQAPEDLALTYLRSLSSQGQIPPPQSLTINGSDIIVEAWYRDSGGTPTPVLAETEIRTLANGAVEAHGQSLRSQYELALLSPTGSQLQLERGATLSSYGQDRGDFPTYVPMTGNETDVDLTGSLRIATGQQTLRVHGPVTVALWSWNLTVNGDTESAWSGQRPHGSGALGGAVEGTDSQLLVIQVLNGTVTLNVGPEQDLLAFVGTGQFKASGTTTAMKAWDPNQDLRNEATTRAFVGNYTIETNRIDNETFEATFIERPGPTSVDNATIENPFDPRDDAAAEAQGGTLNVPKARDSTAILISAIAAIVAAMTAAAIAYATRWRRLTRRFANGDYRHVAQHAGRFHGSRRHAGDAQVMTAVAGIKLGQYGFVLDNLKHFAAIDGGVHAVLEGHALLGLGRLDEAQRLLTDVQAAQARNHPFTQSLETGDQSPAYT